MGLNIFPYKTMQKVIVTKDDDGIRIDRWFQRHYQGIPFSLIAKLLRKKRVKINGKRAKLAQRVEEGDTLFFPDIKQEDSSEPMRLPENLVKALQGSVIYMDDDIIVLNKPAGLAVQGGSKIKYCVDNLAECLKYDYEEKPKLVHRLDKETSGVLLLARRTAIAAQLASSFKQRDLKKTYLALVHGHPRPHEGKIDVSLEKISERGFEKTGKSEKGKRAITNYKLLDHIADDASLLELDLVTGRTHQIRAHLSLINCPIVGDRKYNKKDQVEFPVDNLLLHAHHMTIELDGTQMSFTAPLPKYFTDALKFYGLRVS
jgi:23S rRNA pseudouridine955/2504/2580 synthase